MRRDWISKRCARTGTSIGGTQGMTFKDMPLRKIISRLVHSDDMFTPDIVELDCGHIAHSNGMYRARCAKCRDNKPKDDISFWL
jgi:hypothetical protein